MASKLAASATASLGPLAGPMRRLRSEASMCSAAERIRSNGRTARPDHHHASATATGPSATTVTTVQSDGSTMDRSAFQPWPSESSSVISLSVTEVITNTSSTGR